MLQHAGYEKSEGQFQYCFEISCPIRVQLKTPVSWDVDYDGVRSFETPGIIYPTTQPNISEDMNIQQYRYENIKFNKSKP